MDNEIYKAALDYVEKYGYSVIPVDATTKRASIKWQRYQTVKPTKEELQSWFFNNNGLGIAIVTGAISNLFAVDLDRYKSEYDEELALQYFPDSLITPTVESINGGLHLYFQDPGCGASIRAGVLQGIDYRGEGGYIIAPPTRNKDGKSYKWLVSPAAAAAASLPSSFLSIIKKEDISSLNKNKINIYTRGVDNAVFSSQQMSTPSTNVYKRGTRDQDLFHIANLLVKARCGPEYLHKTLEILALNCDPPFPLDEAKIKIRSAIERANRRERNLAQEVRDYILSTNGVFLSTDVYKTLQLSTREDAKNLSIILARLSKEDPPLIEKSGTRNGCWRSIDRTEELIDIFNVDTTPFNIKLPLDIHEYVTLHKSNVIVIAGESNAGKTSFCLNVAARNKNVHEINYLSSEMQNGAELRIRLDEFQYPIDFWRPIRFEFRTDDFTSKIRPNALNIIDYLDEGSDAEAYKMGSRIRAIANKLQGGVALIAIQKAPNKDYGFGGAGTLNRARLYLTTSTKGVMTIVKGKIWRNKSVNPNGLYCDYKLVAGCRYIIGDRGWMR